MQIDDNSQFCKYCGHEHVLKKPFNPIEHSRQVGHVFYKKEFLENNATEWERYNEQQERIMKNQLKSKNIIEVRNFFKEVNVQNFGLFICGLMLLIAILDLPYGYFRLLRAVIVVTSFYVALYKYTIIPVKIFLVISLILFNPFAPFEFEKSAWIIIDLIFGIIFLSIPIIDHFNISTMTSNKTKGWRK